MNLPVQPDQAPLPADDAGKTRASRARHSSPRFVVHDVQVVDGATPASAGGTVLKWQDDNGAWHEVLWHAESGAAAPRRIVLADDQFSADAAYRLACEGTALLWTGDFHNARQLLQAVARRLDASGQARRKPGKAGADESTYPERFHRYRMAQAQRARALGMLIVPLAADHTIALRRAPDVREACRQAYGPPSHGLSMWVSLREIQGLIGAHEWQRKGVPVSALGADAAGEVRRIHPRHGVFSPVRSEYLELLQQATWPRGQLPRIAFDIGTGTGVIAVLLALRGVARVVATELNPRALVCARDNVARLKLGSAIEVHQQDLFPEGRADLVVCNPPWLPGKPASLIEQGIYDPDSRMLKAFLQGLREHLNPSGEGWLVLSDLAEHLKLRSREQLLGWIEASGLVVRERLDIRPQHPKATDAADPLHLARRAEVTSLWRLATA